MINLFHLDFTNNTCSHSLKHQLHPNLLHYFTFLKYLNLDLIINIWKRKKTRKKGRDLNWMKGSKLESRYLKLCYKFRTFNRCIKASFYILDIKKFLMFRSSKDLASHLFQNTRLSLWNTQPSFWNTRPSFWNTWLSFWKFKRKLNARPRA